MKSYDPKKPIIGIHIPKCAGTSLSNVLKRWFKWRLYKHYFNEKRNRMPKKHRLSPIYARHKFKKGICIYGHFNRVRNFGITDYYPEIDQFFTIIRDPFETALSLYFSGKSLGEKRIRAGKVEKTLDKYQNINDFLRTIMNEPYMVNYLPGEINLDNYQAVFDKQFVYIGIMEDLQTSVDKLAEKLGYSKIKVKHLNPSQHDEEILPEIKEAFIQRRTLEYAIYDYALNHYKV